MTSDTRRLKGLCDFLTRSLSGRVRQRDLLDDIIISADEIATNIIIHAYKREKGRPISVGLTVDGEKVVLTFRHAGTVFDPKKVPRPVLSKSMAERRSGGLGLFIIDQLMDEVIYSFKKDKDDLNSITVVKYYSGQGEHHDHKDPDSARQS
jgi:anti-sigma regulatory factor (Ser/Thr protein kinase)